METLLDKEIIISGNSSDVFHKVFLVKEILAKGFDKAIKFKSDTDIQFLHAIKNKQPMDVLNELEQYLYTL